jgi:hypothetical protein
MARLSEAVERATLWTWNAIGKADARDAQEPYPQIKPVAPVPGEGVKTRRWLAWQCKAQPLQQRLEFGLFPPSRFFQEWASPLAVINYLLLRAASGYTG